MGGASSVQQYSQLVFQSWSACVVGRVLWNIYMRGAGNNGQDDVNNQHVMTLGARRERN